MIYGLALSNHPSYPQGVLVGAGSTRSSDGSVELALPNPICKKLAAGWSAGDNANGLDTGSPSPSTSYHVHIISNGTATDILFSASAVSPVMPSGWVTRKRLGAVVTDAAGIIRPFVQAGDFFAYRNNVLDVAYLPNALPIVQRALSVPAGVKVKAALKVIHNGTSAGSAWVTVRDPDLGVTGAFAGVDADIYRPNGDATVALMDVWTDAAGHVYTGDSAAAGDGKIQIYTRGWFDPRNG